MFGRRRSMQKLFAAILLLVFCAGCSPSREEVYKNHPKYEIKTATNLPKGSLLVPTNDMRLVPLEEMPIPTKIGKPRNTPLEPYEPKPLLYKGQLKKMWSKNNLKNKDYSGYGVTSDNFEDGWQIQNGSDSGLYDPATGKKIGARFEYYLLDEKNGVAFAEDRNLLYFQRYAVSVSLGLNEEYWRLPLEELDLWVSSKDSSVYYRGNLDSILLKVNAWTGIPDWELKRGRKGLFFGRYAFTNKYIFIDGDEWFEPTQYYLYRINPETLEIMKVDFKNFNTFFIDGDRLYVISEEGKVLTEIDPETCVPSKTFKIDEYIKGGVLELVEDPNVAFLSVTSKNGNFIFNLKEPKNPIPIDGYTDSIWSSKKGWQINKHYGIVYSKKKISWFDFSTGEQYWWIDKADLGLEKGESYDVLECDWRGVLVATRDEVIAFGPP
ncbi:MAG TPA: hypothetical protein PLX04_06175 [Caldisericia bacterium]|nr:hypothetical protein [Caldisericia bacterium]HPL89817.1 hypothetical protein [Caldisericia bacterium]HQG59702.1 hypothetical protein [Caldisericia bacterium]HQH49042.1 hypothetical protein [Caldisericia bacterium]HQJ44195.1 hypothetical protein [Caldisericia bacterium]